MSHLLGRADSETSHKQNKRSC